LIDVSVSTSEPISPELALVSPELRIRAISAMPEMHIDELIVSGERTSARPPEPSRLGAGVRLCASLIVYACWQAFIGALFGLAAFVAFTAVLLGVAAIRY
jgi:hypothetical protein